MTRSFRFFEHQNWPDGEKVNDPYALSWETTFFKQERERFCYQVRKNGKEVSILTNYFIGVDWLTEFGQHIEVYPKLDKNYAPTDFWKMVVAAFKHPLSSLYVDNLIEIKFHSPLIPIKKEQDFLTPLIIIAFLRLLKDISRKGLRKGYYKVSRDLHSRVKGKVVINATLKRNTLKGKVLDTYCQFQEFGINCIENRILKKALIIAKRYLLESKDWSSGEMTLQQDLGYILAAFDEVSAEVDARSISSVKKSAFYREYDTAIELAQLLFKRFGYNINSACAGEISYIPPYWIDMSKLFELYALGILYEKFGNNVQYQIETTGIVDFIVSGEQKWIIDAKYKLRYDSTYELKDIRQVSGYARTKELLKKIGYNENEMQSIVPPCLIIYPDQISGKDTFIKPNSFDPIPLNKFVQIYKIGISLPTSTPSNDASA